jgi:hypothetical protein
MRGFLARLCRSNASRLFSRTFLMRFDPVRLFEETVWFSKAQKAEFRLG